MPALGRNGGAPPFGDDIISATYTEECDVIDVSNRSNAGSGYKASKAGFVTKTWEIECHSEGGAISDLTSDGSGFTVMSITESASVDGAKTFTITAKEA
jgi:hypothetical protein